MEIARQRERKHVLGRAHLQSSGVKPGPLNNQKLLGTGSLLLNILLFVCLEGWGQEDKCRVMRLER